MLGSMPKVPWNSSTPKSHTRAVRSLPAEMITGRPFSSQAATAFTGRSWPVNGPGAGSPVCRSTCTVLSKLSKMMTGRPVITRFRPGPINPCSPQGVVQVDGHRTVVVPPLREVAHGSGVARCPPVVVLALVDALGGADRLGAVADFIPGGRPVMVEGPAVHAFRVRLGCH